MRTFLARLIPFIFLGIMIVFLVIGLLILSQLLIYGAIIGCVLFFFAWLRELLFAKKTRLPIEKKSTQGRTIDHNNL